MSTIRLTDDPLEAKVYTHLGFTYDKESQTVVWDKEARPRFFALIDINPGKIVGHWREGDTQKCTADHSRRDTIQATADGTAARVFSFMNHSKNGPEDTSGFASRAERAMISELFDPRTGKPTGKPSAQSKSATAVEVSTTGDTIPE